GVLVGGRGGGPGGGVWAALPALRRAGCRGLWSGRRDSNSRLPFRAGRARALAAQNDAAASCQPEHRTGDLCSIRGRDHGPKAAGPPVSHTHLLYQSASFVAVSVTRVSGN